MDEVWMLILLAIAMLAGCYLSGMVPLVVSMSEEKLQLISVLGAGLLVGTALAVIIPEGVNTLYTLEGSHPEHIKEQTLPVENGEVAADHTQYLEPHNVIGLALVLGFLFMLLVDQIGGAHSHSQDTEVGGVGRDRDKMTATIGLVVHAAADGIALGAAATTSHADVEMIVFVAIMLHKAPAAFGLVTFLMHSGIERSRIRRHLLVFALAAPILAIITYFGLSQKGKETLSSMNATGFTMLFSAGTFLYVATIHVLPEVTHRKSSGDSSDHGGLRKLEFVALVIGALLPLILTLGHHH
ncbi:hypothetical protein CHUAL_012244 [Chamberlinius hualienensis]